MDDVIHATFHKVFQQKEPKSYEILKQQLVGEIKNKK